MRRKSVRRRVVATILVACNVLILTGVIGFFAFGTRPDPTGQTALSSRAIASSEPEVAALDQLSSANIALTVAKMGSMPETTAITNQADSEDFLLEQASTANATMSTKPQVVSSDFKSVADIQSYVVQPGDTISSIAGKFGVTSDSIRWSNNILSGDKVDLGTKVTIPPVNGIVYTVASGDTADSIASKYKADKMKLIAFNDAEISGFTVGQKIVIPDGVKVAAPAFTRASTATLNLGSITYGYNGYDRGYCTWYVANVRAAAGNPIPAGLGNAATWGTRARAFGLPTGTTPQVGAAVVTSTRGAGHVAYVEKVNGDGTIWVSEMNSRGQVSMTDSTPTGGWGKRDYKIISASGHTYIY